MKDISDKNQIQSKVNKVFIQSPDTSEDPNKIKLEPLA